MDQRNSAAIQIFVDREHPFVSAGELVTGIFHLRVTQGMIEADAISIKLIGTIGHMTTRHPRLDGRSKTPVHHDFKFLSTRTLLTRAEKHGRALVYRNGQWSWPFQLVLPDHLPPSIGQPHRYPHVRYYLKLVIRRSWCERNIRHRHGLIVFPRVNLLQNPSCFQSRTFQSQNDSDLTLTGTLEKTGFVSGDPIVGILEITNPKRLLIKHVSLSLWQRAQIGSTWEQPTMFQTVLPRPMDIRDEQWTETFSIEIPRVALPPSCEFEGGSHRLASVKLDYILAFVVSVEQSSVNSTATIPIIVGIEPTSNRDEVRAISSVSVRSLSDDEDIHCAQEDPPTSYQPLVQSSQL
jgi:hypothetical protein